MVKKVRLSAAALRSLLRMDVDTRTMKIAMMIMTEMRKYPRRSRITGVMKIKRINRLWMIISDRGVSGGTRKRFSTVESAITITNPIRMTCNNAPI